MKITAKVGRKATRSRPTGSQPSRAARMLALAYYVERLIDAGELRDYADAARRLRVSRARVTQIMNLQNLPLAVQEDILTGAFRAAERNLRSW